MAVFASNPLGGEGRKATEVDDDPLRGRADGPRDRPTTKVVITPKSASQAFEVC